MRSGDYIDSLRNQRDLAQKALARMKLEKDRLQAQLDEARRELEELKRNNCFLP